MSSGRLRRRTAWAAAVGGIVCACLAVWAVIPMAGAQETQLKSWAIERLDVVLDVQENGDVIADETFTYLFTGSFHWIERGVPVDAGEGIDSIEVRDGQGALLPENDSGEVGTFSSYTEGDKVWIRVNLDVTDGPATYTFRYRTKSLVSFGRDDDGFVWYLLDGEFDTAVGELQATVTLPGEVPSEDIMYETDLGYGVQASVSSPGPSTLVYRATDIYPYTHFWTRTGFPKGVVTHHWTAREVASFITPKLGFVIPIFTFLIVLLIWVRRGRDDPSQMYAKYVSEPPSDLSPGLVGALIDEKVDTKEVMATVIDLASRGYLDIAEGGTGAKAAKSGTTFTRAKPLDDLQGFEKTVAVSLFDSGHPDQVTAAELKNHFYVHVQPIVAEIYEAVTSGGFFKSNPKKTRSAWVGYGFIALAVAVAGYFLLRWARVDGYGYFVTGCVFAAIVLWGFGPRMPGRTAKGANEQRQWESFRTYLQDLTRFQDMDAAKEKYEAYLPYAIALGVEKQWTRRFEDITVSPPDWYHPTVILGDMRSRPVIIGGAGRVGDTVAGQGGSLGGGFSLNDVSTSLFGALNKVSSAMTASPSSQSGGRGAWGGGGFSGGGFSGGGFSGGGGGGGMRAG